jgi:hypothetical protein
VSGDSAHCGDVAMPMIAHGVADSEARFYWHLGDKGKDWPHFVEKQIKPFAPATVYLVIGAGDLIGHNREEYRTFFHDWIDAPGVRETRAKENLLEAEPQTYYHWIQNGVDFIALDNATKDQSDAAQLRWLEKVLTRDANNQAIKSVVIGMHEALSRTGQIYQNLLKLRDQAHKNVYVLASHFNFPLDGRFNSEYWKTHDGVLSEWVVNTSIGYLMAKVEPLTGTVSFEIVPLGKTAVTHCE